MESFESAIAACSLRRDLSRCRWEIVAQNGESSIIVFSNRVPTEKRERWTVLTEPWPNLHSITFTSLFEGGCPTNRRRAKFVTWRMRANRILRAQQDGEAAELPPGRGAHREDRPDLLATERCRGICRTPKADPPFPDLVNGDGVLGCAFGFESLTGESDLGWNPDALFVFD
jgi:hypothetical protein